MLDYEGMFRAATGRGPFPYQVRLAHEPLPHLLRVPTGAGKTAAAVLGWLYRRRFHPDETVRRETPRRLVYCLPMRVLVEQTVDAVGRWLANLDLRQEIGVYQLMGGAVEKDWVRWPERDAVLVGTMDMLLSRALNRGFAASRFRWPMEFGLLNNDCLWVLDEVQLMGNGLAASAQLAGLRQAFGTAAPCPSLWMSATADASWLETVDHPGPFTTQELTEADRSNGELALRLKARKDLRKLPVRDWPADGATAVLELHRPRTLTLVVCNTVERARVLFDRLRAAGPAADLRLLHSRFRPPDRQRAVRAAFCSPTPNAGRIVVATQVVEAGVDVSAATLVTELAPWASIVQRLGRCNRFAEHPDAVVRWVDLSSKEVLPYEDRELNEARGRLEELEGESVSPLRLEAMAPGRPPRATHVVRRMDVLDLFDTEPDLAGNDVDVSRFIRDDADDVDIQLLWRRWEGDEPPADCPRPTRDELCGVPVGEVRRFVQRRKGRQFVWDQLDRRWRQLEPDELRPGVVLLLPADVGGYHPDLGWDPSTEGPVPPLVNLVREAEAEEGLGDDPPEETAGTWVSLEEHVCHVAERLRCLLAGLGRHFQPWEWQALEVAALWHNLGKAHPVFQEALLASASAPQPRPGVLWAKAPMTPGARPRYERPNFRHELASALAVLAAPQTAHGLEGASLDLVAYLVAAHHGKVRMVIRSLPGEKRPDNPERRFARGVWDGDQLGPVAFDGLSVPLITLDLSLMEAGRGPDGRPSWAERTLRLRDRVGPFRLAFLETVLRAADWGASAEEVADA